MAKQKVIKRYLLVGFLLVCLFLIGFSWMDGLLDEQTSQPGYYRNTVPPNEEFYLTRTAEYENYLLGTPEPEHEHGENSHGKNQESHDWTPTPTIDWDAREDDV